MSASSHLHAEDNTNPALEDARQDGDLFDVDKNPDLMAKLSVNSPQKELGKKGRQTAAESTFFGNLEHVAGPDEDASNVDLENEWHQTWTTHDRSASWLSTLLPNDIPNARILAFGFNMLKRLESELKVLKYATRNFIHGLSILRKDDSRPVIFVAHSLGGILLRRALIKVPDLRDSFVGIVFLGTPNLQASESDRTKWVEVLNNLCQSINLNWKPSLESIEQLAKLNYRFNSWFHQVSQGSPIDIVCFYETLPVYRIGIAVPRDIAIIRRFEKYPLATDHTNMTRFESVFDPGYQSLIKTLKAMIRRSKGIDASVESLSATSRQTISQPLFPSMRPKSPFPDGRELIISSSETAANNVKKYASLALALEDHGQFEAAGKEYEHAMQECKEKLGSNNEIYLFCLDKAASMLRDRSKYAPAEVKAREAWRTRINSLQAASSATLSSAGNLARIMRYQGRYREAYVLLANALDATPGSPFFTISGTAAVSILAKILKELGIYQICELLSRDVVRACSILLGRDHPFTLNRESDLAVVLSKRGKFQAAEAIGKRALDVMEKTMGTDHPHTLRTAKRVASYMRFQGRYTEALPLLKRTLHTQEQLLTSKHPDSLSTKCSLAAVHALQRNYAAAEVLFEQASEDRKLVFEKDHPDVIWTDNALEAVRTLRKLQVRLSKLRQRQKESASAIQSSIKEDKTEELVVLKEINTRENYLRSPTTPSKEEIDNEVEAFDKLHETVTFLSDDESVSVSIDHDPETFVTRDIHRDLRAAATQGHEEAVIAMLHNLADPRTQGGYYTNALRAGSYSGNANLVKSMLLWSEQAGSAFGQNIYNEKIVGSALRVAAVRGHEEVVQVLLDHDAIPDSEGGYYGTALQAASFSGSIKIVECLLHHYADVDTQAGLFGFATRSAALRGDKDVVKMLLENNASPNPRDGRLNSALQAAWIREHKDVAEELLRNDADVNSQDASFGTPLQEASWKGDTALVALLLDKGADPNLHGGVIGSALEMAASSNHREIVEQLIAASDDMELEGYGSALQAASMNGHIDVVKALLDRGQGQEIEGYGNAIQAALMEGHETVMRMLLERAAQTLEDSGLRDPYAQTLETLSTSASQHYPDR